jgi:multiple sugar transport system substrate-binding protein
MKKLLLVVFVLAATIFMGQQITVIGPWSGAEKDAFMPVLEKFEEQTGIEVQYQIYRAEDLANLLPAQFATKRTPGDVIFMWTSFMEKNTEHIVNLSDIIKPENFRPGALDNVTVDGEIIGIPYTGKVKPGFWYRKSFFEEHGLTEPKTWDEFVALLEDISKIEGITAPIASGNGVGWPLSDVTEHFILTFGGAELQKDLIAGNVNWTGETAKKPINKLASLLSEGYFGEPVEWTTVLEQWWQGQYGLYFMGQWLTGMVDDPSDLGVLALPGNEAVVFALDYAFIPKYSKNVDAAKQLIEFLAGPEGQTAQVEQGGHIASANGVPLDAYPPVDREIAELLEGKATVNDLDDSIGGMWQTTFWDQLKLLWVRPGRLDSVLESLQSKMP